MRAGAGGRGGKEGGRSVSVEMLLNGQVSQTIFPKIQNVFSDSTWAASFLPHTSQLRLTHTVGEAARKENTF